MNKHFVHRYIPNTAPGIREKMLKEIGISDVEQIYNEIPEKIRFKGKLDIPAEQLSELEVLKQVKTILIKNKTIENSLSFLGAGCWPHYVPALCDEISGRSEFLTAYAGLEATDLGRYQALFEFQSMMGDLFAMDVVGAPVYDGLSASGDAILMAAKITGRRELLVPETISYDRLLVLKVYSEPWLSIIKVKSRRNTGELDLNDLKTKITNNTAAVFIENPTYLGVIESQCKDIAHIAHDYGALLVAFVNPISLGILTPPGEFGADIACAEGQPLGNHISCGGAMLGILACHDEKRFVSAIPSFLITITKTSVKGEYAFSWHTAFDEKWERIVFTARDKAKSFTGTSSALWAINAAVYMALLGPKGFRQIGEVNIQKSYYAIKCLSKIGGIKVPLFSSMHFNEFTVNFDRTGKTVEEINKALLKRGIMGGKDISKEFPEFGNTAIYCVTEIHSKEDIDRLTKALKEVIQ